MKFLDLTIPRDRATLPPGEPKTMNIELPFPPSVNSYWRKVNGRTLISKKGREYREAVHLACWMNHTQKIDGPLRVRIEAHPPNQAKRDLDNLLKAPLDAMQAAGVYEDDSQIDLIEVSRGVVVPGGKLIVSVMPLESPEMPQGSDLERDLTERASELKRELESVLAALASVSQ